MEGLLRDVEGEAGATQMTQEQFDSLPEPVQRRWRDEVSSIRPPSKDLVEITQWCLTDYVPVPPGISVRWKQ